MARIQRYALFIDYQDHYLQWLHWPDREAFKHNAREVADVLTQNGHTPIWILMQPSYGTSLYNKPPSFISPEERDSPDQQERILLHSLFFDPDLIRPGEGLMIKTNNNAFAFDDNPMVAYFRRQAALIETTLCGANTTQCVASTVCGIAQTPVIHRCAVLTDHLADMNFDRDGRNPPDWHQKRVLSRLADKDKRKFSFLTAQDYLRNLTPYTKKATP
ncbi:MAG: isochorismatase family protein [Alphaproteobacteria bacterium]|nr:isochorismatase family protein [Alphaproteobacteria bacterium]